MFFSFRQFYRRYKFVLDSRSCSVWSFWNWVVETSTRAHRRPQYLRTTTNGFCRNVRATEGYDSSRAVRWRSRKFPCARRTVDGIQGSHRSVANTRLADRLASYFPSNNGMDRTTPAFEYSTRIRSFWNVPVIVRSIASFNRILHSDRMIFVVVVVFTLNRNEPFFFADTFYV